MESTPPSEPPAQAIVREAPLLDVSQKLLGVDELYALLDAATHYRLLNAAIARDDHAEPLVFP